MYYFKTRQNNTVIHIHIFICLKYFRKKMLCQGGGGEVDEIGTAKCHSFEAEQ